MSETIVPAIPALPSTFSPQERIFLLALKEIIEVREARRGDPLDSAVTYRSLLGDSAVLLNLQTLGRRPAVVNLGGTAIDSTIPPALSGFTASGAYTNIILTWDTPLYGNHAYVEVWRNLVDTLGTATLIGTTSAAIYADTCGENHTYYYWARSVSTSDIRGPYNALHGIVGATAPDVAYLVGILGGQIGTSELVTSLNARINLIDDSGATLTSVTTRIANEANARTTADSAEVAARNSAIATQATATTTQITAAVLTETNARTTADSAIASTVTTLSSTVGANTTAISTEASTRATQTGALYSQYTVKLDSNGYVSGFGLASTTYNATPYSSFIVRADTFAVGAPGSTTVNPFVVQVSPTTINGVAVPAGVYMDSAYIKNGSIANAKIGNAAIDSAKIVDLAVTNAKIADATITSAKITSISADKITTGTLSAAEYISVGSGATAVIVSGAGNIRGGQSAYNTGSGFFMGYSGVDYKFSLGDTTKGLTWDGTAFTIKGDMTAGSISLGGSFGVTSAGAVTIRSGTTGARLEITNSVIKVFDASGNLRVKIGDLLA